MKQTRIGQTFPDYSAYDLEAEKTRLRNFLETQDLWIPPGFYDGLRVGDVVDLYTSPPDLKQLYCNAEFRRLCSYSDEQMRSVPFTKLFWRSDEVQTQLVRRTTEIALHSDGAERWGIDNHELVESLHPRKRTFEIDLGWVAPCFKKATNERVAFVSSLRVSLIFEWPDVENGSA